MLGGLLWGANFDDLAHRWWATGGVGLATALLLVGGGLHPALRGPAWRVASWPGRLSYGCYLWHIPVLFLAWPLLAGRGAGAAIILFLFLVWSVSAISYYGFELPANRWVRARWGTGSPGQLQDAGAR
jgi:peptidoglycan/LPS O-acetylase OafA/YrhL